MRKLISKQSEESGQIVILLVIAIVALLVVAAMTVDGGMLYTERRFAQNAADASSLAGAGSIANELVDDGIFYSNFVCNNLTTYINQGVAEAQLRASTNNFAGLNQVNDPTINHGIYIDCHEEINNKYLDFYVTITTETPTSFLHLIDQDLLHSTVQAVTRLYPQHDLGYGNAIVSLNDNCTNATDGIVYNGGGNEEVNIINGGIWSNDCITLNGGVEVNLIDDDLTDGYTPSTNLLDPAGVDLKNNSVLNPPTWNIFLSDNLMNLDEEAQEIKTLIEQSCDFTGTLTDYNVTNNNNITLSPGTYGSLRLSGDANTTSVTLESGGLENPIFCFDGNVDIQGGTLTGDPVTIYLKNGSLDITASAAVHLIAPFADEYDNFNILDGLLIFMDPANSNSIEIQGDSTSVVAGTIFSLNGDVKLAGNPGAASQGFSTQVIAYNVEIEGNVDFDINFDLSNTSITDSKLHLLR